MGWDFDRNYRETKADKFWAAVTFTIAGIVGFTPIALMAWSIGSGIVAWFGGTGAAG